MTRPAKPARTRSVSATDRRNNFGEVLARVVRDGRVFITRHRRPEAVVLSIEEYEALAEAHGVDGRAHHEDPEQIFQDSRMAVKGADAVLGPGFLAFVLQHHVDVDRLEAGTPVGLDSMGARDMVIRA
jgi:prevent-host-death family protein